MNYKAILLDLDNTLYDYEPIHHASIKNVESFSIKNGFVKSTKEFQEIFSAARHEIHIELQNTASSHNRLLYFQRFLEKLNIFPDIFALQMYNCYWDTFISKLELTDEIKKFLIDNSQKKICIVTDLTAHIQFRKIKKLELEKYIDKIVTSEEAGIEKPDSKIFHLALKKLKLTTDDVCMIGDNFEKDILGATKLGIKAFWLNKTHINIELPPNAVEFKNFKELKVLINE